MEIFIFTQYLIKNSGTKPELNFRWHQAEPRFIKGETEGKTPPTYHTGVVEEDSAVTVAANSSSSHYNKQGQRWKVDGERPCQLQPSTAPMCGRPGLAQASTIAAKAARAPHLEHLCCSKQLVPGFLPPQSRGAAVETHPAGIISDLTTKLKVQFSYKLQLVVHK
jgi:hypothetical protein